MPAPLAIIETFSDNAGTTVVVTAKSLHILSESGEILLFCEEVETNPRGVYPKNLTIPATVDMLVPIVDSQGNPVWENPEAAENERVQATINEWDMWKYLIFDHNMVALGAAIGAAIMRKKGLINDPLVFVQS